MLAGKTYSRCRGGQSSSAMPQQTDILHGRKNLNVFYLIFAKFAMFIVRESAKVGLTGSVVRSVETDSIGLQTSAANIGRLRENLTTLFTSQSITWRMWTHDAQSTSECGLSDWI